VRRSDAIVAGEWPAGKKANTIGEDHAVRRAGRHLSAADALWSFLLDYRSEVVCEIAPDRP
jgi:hypothetical protein